MYISDIEIQYQTVIGSNNMRTRIKNENTASHQRLKFIRNSNTIFVFY